VFCLKLDNLLEVRNQKLNVVIEFQIADSLLISRILGRWTHKKSGRSYHDEFNPPKVSGLDDVTGEPLERRSDDNPESLKKRVEQFHLNTKPLAEYYSQHNLLKSIDASKPPADVSEDIKTIFENIKTQVGSLTGCTRQTVQQHTTGFLLFFLNQVQDACHVETSISEADRTRIVP
jgi:hypothetical protein